MLNVYKPILVWTVQTVEVIEYTFTEGLLTVEKFTYCELNGQKHLLKIIIIFGYLYIYDVQIGSKPCIQVLKGQ